MNITMDKAKKTMLTQESEVTAEYTQYDFNKLCVYIYIHVYIHIHTHAAIKRKAKE